MKVFFIQYRLIINFLKLLEFTVDKLLFVFFTVITAVFTLGNAAPFLTTMAS